MFLSVVLVPCAFAQDTLSDEILTQAKAQADLFLELKNALGLDWLDKYNTYLQNPSVNPEPSWTLSVQDLINNGYLSAGFPSDFSLSPSGAEVVISRPVSTQSIRDAVTIYLPSATISGNTVSLLVQRPAQWIAWQDALNGKVSRDGSGDPDILPGADLDFGSGSKIEFISNDGKILGVNSLTYKGEELESRFVNASGDNMTGPLYINGSVVWHAGNDGSESGLDADLLDGQHGSFYQDASNLNTGIVPVARLAGKYDIDISGNAATATNANYASLAGDADTVDGRHASEFALSGHSHGQYVQKSGDTMTGKLTLPEMEVNQGGIIRLNTSSGETSISADAGNLNLQANKVIVPSSMDVGGIRTTDSVAQDIFGWKVALDISGNNIGIRNSDNKIILGFNKDGVSIIDTTDGRPMAQLTKDGQLYVDRNKVWHAGNDGAESGLDADLLDGLDSSAFLRYTHIPAGSDLNDYFKTGFYYNGLTVDARTMKNIPYPEAFFMIAIGDGTGVQIFFPYNINSSTRRFYIRYHYAYINYFSPWAYVNLDGDQPTYNPGTRVYVDLSNNPIDVSSILPPPVQIAYNEISDETGTYKMWKYKQVFNNSDVIGYIKSAFMSQIKARTGLSSIDTIGVVEKVTPQINGNILAAGAVCHRLVSGVAIPYRTFGYDFYNSISTAKDMVGKTQNVVSSSRCIGNVISFEIYTMKSSYQYGSTYLEAQSQGQLLITGVWGQY